MDLLIILAVLAAAVIALWAVADACMPTTSGRVLGLYLAAIAAAAAGSIWSTFFYVYARNENTRVHGWPVPTIIFQRDTPESEWLDFIGPTLILGLPMNFVAFLFLPSVTTIVVARRRRRSVPRE